MSNTTATANSYSVSQSSRSHRDGVYRGRNCGSFTSFFDLDRADVVKGPQGALFGRNAIAGAISVVTQRPIDALDGKTSLGVEENDQYDFMGTLNVPNVPFNERVTLRRTGRRAAEPVTMA